MPTPTDPRREHTSTYVVQDRSSAEEMTRLQLQDQMITASMGGALPEQPDPKDFQRVLDVGCGTGGWLVEVAKTYPSISLLVGVDVSDKLLEHARAQAAAQQVSDRMHFVGMDALRMLEFPFGYFDLVNHRYGMSWLRTWEWPKLLSEYQRISRSGAVIRITEVDFVTESSSPALVRLSDLLLQAFYQAGHFFTPNHNGVTSELARLLRQYGFQNVQTHAYAPRFRAGTREGQQFAEDMKLASRMALPFLRKWIRLPDDYAEIYQQMLIEMQQPDFVATWNLLTAWGTTPA